MDAADSVLLEYSHFLAYHPLRFTFVRDILAYFYGHLPGNLVVRVLKVLDLSKVIEKRFDLFDSENNLKLIPLLDFCLKDFVEYCFI